jgi:microsomal dipeptidase-like Zn-dependent dipeptidase
MHARVIHANISDLAEAKRGLDEEVIRGIRESNGFLGAYFVAIDDSHGISIEVFETEELARATAPAEGAEAPGVTVRTIEFGEVIGSA